MKSPNHQITKSLNFLSLLRSLFFVIPLIGLYTVVMGALSLAGSLFDPSGRFQHGCARLWARLILFTSGVHVEVAGLENVERSAPCVFCANHLSLMDTPLVFAHVPVRFRILAKQYVFRIPVLAAHLRRSGHLPVDETNPRAALRSFELAAQHIRAGAPVMLFPEGGRSPDGRLGEFKPGAAMLAIKAGVPLVPMAIYGSRQVLPRGSVHIRPGNVRIRFGKPLPTEGLTYRDRNRLTALAREKIGEMLNEQAADRHLLPA